MKYLQQNFISFTKVYSFSFTILIIGLLLFPITEASAGRISLTTSISSEIDDQLLKIKISVVNNGDESAHNVQAQIKAGKKETLSEKQNELRVKETYKVEAQLPYSFKKSGTYPIILTIHYTDANQYPFSALTCQTIKYQKEELSPIFGHIKPISLSKSGKLKLTLKNLKDKKAKIKTYLVLPREITADKETYELNIPEKSEQYINFTVNNLSALDGSTYRVFAISELEDKNMHYTSITPGTITINSAKKVLGLSYINIIIILAVLIIIFIAVQFFIRK